MDLEATAQALVTETALPEQVAAPEPQNDEPDYGAVYDKLTAEEPAEAEPEKAEEVAEAPKAEEPAQEAVDAPTDVPVALRKHWQALPEDAREAVLSSQREMSRKLSDMGRQVQGIAPIRDVLVEAIKERPELAHMQPAELARDALTLARISAEFQRNPIGAFHKLAEEKGLTEALRKFYGGQPQEAQQTASLHNEIRALKAQLAQAASPEFIREQVSAVTMQERMVAEVSSFAQEQEHWNAEIPGLFDESGRQLTIQDKLPRVIALAKESMPNASAKDVLARAYDLALQTYRPDLKAKAQAAVEAAAAPDPERTQAALKAKSINVTGRTTGKPREMSEEEMLAAVYDRAVRK